ncbi:uncharacterized protein LOC109841770 [Asparagus officinalis]|uniref:uncharacterized protein LOC109841770 n=1 Tax=Asparagus officinalis TaxID=4686 RepID=UPI00098DE634|nr:uncharacterized protein LOC109841770 [Asparagus officinalis]
MGIAGPGVQPDTATVPGVESPHSSGASPSLPSGASNLSAGADVPSSAAVPEPVGSQPDGTSVGVGSRSSLHERVRSLLADTDPDGEAFRTDLSFFTAWYNGLIEKLLHRGGGFDQFRRSFSRHMTMMREEGYPELADSFTADFAALESEIRELKELEVTGASSFVSSELEHRMEQCELFRRICPS